MFKHLHLLAFICVVCSSSQLFAQGAIVSAAGSVNRSMGGATVAAPIDAIGAIYWNPAAISGLERSEMAFGVDLLHSTQTVASSIGNFAGETESDNGFMPIPNVGWVYKTGIPEVTLGLGVNSIAGFKTNLPADPSNPVLSPLIMGRVSSEASFMQIAPVVSIAVSDSLSLAAGPTVTTGQVGVEPFVFDSANADGSYSNGRSTRYHWGAGMQLGAYYIANCDWRFGASWKSTTYMERFTFNGSDENGNPRLLSAAIDLPMMTSVGTSYSGFENWLIALDVRHIDYENTDGWGDRAFFDNQGRLRGLDYSSVLATALGIQRKVNEIVTIRGGYTYNQNPVKNSEAFYNIASALIYQHMLSGGFTIAPNDCVSFNAAYSYMFENTRSGQIILPGIGPLGGSTIDNSMYAHFASFGITTKF
jgi:long-chain fatty acid transport protein